MLAAAHRKLLLVLMLAWLAGRLVGGVPTATAHTVVAPTWSDEANVQWRLDSTRAVSLSGVGASTSFKAADDPWNAVSGSTLNFVFEAEASLSDKNLASSPCGDTPPVSSVEVFVYGNPQSQHAITWRCPGIVHLEHAYVGVNSGSTWYVGSGTPLSTQYDLRSSVIHEFGHAAGMNIDFTGSALCDPDNDPPYHTMCGVGLKGNTWKRTLEEHDRHSLAGFY